jgi:hypothetical protein
VRIRRQDLGGFRQAGTGHLVAAESAGQANRGPGAVAHRARWLKAALLRRSTVAVADVTYHLLGEQPKR